MNESCNEPVFSGAEVSILKGIFYKLLTEGDYTAAAAIAKSLFEITAEDGEQWSLYGIAHKIGGNPETTREQLGGTYFNMGLTLLRMDRREEAVESFTRAVEIFPNDPEYLNLLGQAYGELGKVKEAEAYLQKALEIDSKYALGYYDLGVILAKQRTRDREAKRFFDKAIELDPEMAWAYYSIACIDALAGKKGVALKNLERAFEKGVEDKAHIDKDTDLDSLRKDAGYVKLMEKYFGGEEESRGGE
jgi:tetratricopeptide (TPR) repeat protein